MAATLYPVSKLDADQVLQHSYDDATQTLRTTAQAVIIAPPELQVSINHTEDSVRLGDGTNFLTSTTLGPKVALDVNVINSSDATVATTPVIANMLAAVQNSEYSYNLPDGTKRFTIRAREGKMLLSYVSGGTYLTVWTGASYTVENINTTGITLYFQSSRTNDVVEIESWS